MSRRLQIAAAAAAILLAAACNDGGAGSLQFRQRSGEAREGGSQENEAASRSTTITSSLDLQQMLQRPRTLVILPFRNAGRILELEDALWLFHRSLAKRLEDLNRLFETTELRADDVRDLASSPRADEDHYDPTDVALALRSRMEADLVLFGNISLDEETIIIEPKLIEFDGEEHRQVDLPAVQLQIGNFTNFDRDVTEQLINLLISHTQQPG